MGFIEMAGIALSLTMDAFSVCVAAGVKIRKPAFRHYFRMAFHFGLFQFMMPIIGYYGGVLLQDYISRYDHWVAFTLLSIIGLKMIWETLGHKDEDRNQSDPSRGKTLIMLSIATSIDAAAVGFSFALLKIPILVPSIIIGLVCMSFSALGIFLGRMIGSMIGIWAERLGGVTLIAIGVKILADHLG